MRLPTRACGFSDDPEARRRLAENGRRQVLERYEWEAVLGRSLGDVLAP